MRERDAHFGAYEHLKGLPREAEALHTLQKVASLVKPIMRKRSWRVSTLAEFYPSDPHLLGLNINQGQKICIRLRHAADRNQFVPVDQVIETMLHELTHIVWGPHDHNFDGLLEELRSEHQSLRRKGYTGEGFLSDGRKLGGKRVPIQELRRQARAAAEKRQAVGKGSGQRLGGTAVPRGADIRQVIADAVARRNAATAGCASGTKQAPKLAEEASKNGFRTKAEEDDANDRAIAVALAELMAEDESEPESKSRAGADGAAAEEAEEEEEEGEEEGRDGASKEDNGAGWSKQSNCSEGLTWSPRNGLELAGAQQPPMPVRSGPKIAARPPPSTQQRSTTGPGRPVSRLVAEDDARRRVRQPSPSNPSSSNAGPRESTWTCAVCTLINPVELLYCEACLTEKPDRPAIPNPRPDADSSKQRPRASPADGPLGWNCVRCGTFMEKQWWACSLCGTMKASS